MYLNQRNNRIQIWMNDSEADSLNAKVKRSGLSRESYIRSLMSGYAPKELPGADFFALMRELHAIGNRMNQIAAKANAIGFIDAEQYAGNAGELRETTQRIYEAVMLPERME